MVWRPNLANHAGFFWGLPDINVMQAVDDFRFVADHGCIGLIFDTVWEHWATQTPQLYMMGRCAWDPHLDGEAVLADFYQRAFGPAAAEVESYWTFMEETRKKLLESGLSRYKMPELYDDELLNQAEQLLRQAAAKTAGHPEKYRKRVAYVQAGLDYTRLVLQARRWMFEYEKSKNTDAEAAARVEAIWDELDRFLQEHTDALNVPYLRKRQRNMMGLHPDNPMRKRDLRRLGLI
jgi:hypothetical protein